MPIHVQSDEQLKITNQIRQTCYDNVVCLSDAHKRFVAHAPDLGDYKDGAPSGADNTTLFVPESPFDDFDLVMSLGTDGRHRLTLDWDRPDIDTLIGSDTIGTIATISGHRVRPRDLVVTPSTSNYHVWSNRESFSWKNITDMLAHDLVGNPKYAEVNTTKGWCALRPPWKTKDPYANSNWDVDRVARFRNFNWQNATGELPVETTGWDDLFGEDE